MTFLERLLDGAEVEWMPLGQLGEFIRGSGLQKKDLTESGFPAIHYGQIHTKYGLSSNETLSFVSDDVADRFKKARNNDLLLATTSENDEDVGKPLAWLGGDVAISGDMMLFRHSQNVKYLAHFVRTTAFQDQKIRFITGAKVRRISSGDFAKIIVPIPCPENPEKSLAIQAEIVRILDSFTELTAELTAELTVRQKQYHHYRDQLLRFEEGEVEWLTLGDVGEVTMCKRILKSQTAPEGDVPFYKIGTFGKEADAYIARPLFEKYKNKYSYPKRGEILISASGTIGRTVIYDGEDAYFQDSNIIWVKNDENKILNKFLYFFYQIAKWGIAKGGTINRLYLGDVEKMSVPVPTLEEQARIVSILDQFDTLTQSLTDGLPREIELRQKQYAYYRDFAVQLPAPRLG